MSLVKPGKKTVTVVDSIMGSGKTSWATQFINEGPLNRRFLYLTPYLSEVKRIIESTDKNFIEPSEKGGKMNNLKKLIAKGENVACTHKLLEQCDSELIQLLEAENYTLILDEVMTVIDEIKMSKDDIKILLNSVDDEGNPTISVNKKGKVNWNNPIYKNGGYEIIRNLANSGNLTLFEESKMYWLFPMDFFKAFDNVFILTYMFEGQIQCYYYQLFDIKFNYKSVGFDSQRGYFLTDYINYKNEERKHLKELINIHYSTPRDKNDLNKIGEKHNAFSKNHLAENVKNRHYKEKIKNHSNNFYRHKIEAPTKEVIWTTFKDYSKVLCPRGLKNRYVSLTARATNEYAEATTCIYLANRYMNPLIKRFFNERGIKVNEEMFALSEMLQWLFRSAIRNNKPINVYIPSSRMRNLLERYLNNEI